MVHGLPWLTMARIAALGSPQRAGHASITRVCIKITYAPQLAQVNAPIDENLQIANGSEAITFDF
jgi:hypothetical protein